MEAVKKGCLPIIRHLLDIDSKQLDFVVDDNCGRGVTVMQLVLLKGYTWNIPYEDKVIELLLSYRPRFDVKFGDKNNLLEIAENLFDDDSPILALLKEIEREYLDEIFGFGKKRSANRDAARDLYVEYTEKSWNLESLPSVTIKSGDNWSFSVPLHIAAVSSSVVSANLAHPEMREGHGEINLTEYQYGVEVLDTFASMFRVKKINDFRLPAGATLQQID